MREYTEGLLDGYEMCLHHLRKEALETPPIGQVAVGSVDFELVRTVLMESLTARSGIPKEFLVRSILERIEQRQRGRPKVAPEMAPGTTGGTSNKRR